MKEISGVLQFSNKKHFPFGRFKLVTFFMLQACMFLFQYTVVAQEIGKSVQLDSVMVEAVKGGFNVDDFIELVKNDSSFYQSFKNLHVYPFRFKTSLVVLNTRDKEKASLYREATHHVNENREWTQIDKETTTGNIYKKNGSFTYYTAELLDYTFFSKDTGYVTNKSTRNKNDKRKEEENNDNYERLKTLIFNPGSKVEGVPLIGNKMAIFDEDMSPYYDYFINAENYQDTIKCYKFICRAKQNEQLKTSKKAVIKELISWFDRKTFAIVKRKYVLAYSSVFFDFDVTMEVNLTQLNGVLVPVYNSYSGSWDIPFRKPEIVGFTMQFSDFEIR